MSRLVHGCDERQSKPPSSWKTTRDVNGSDDPPAGIIPYLVTVVAAAKGWSIHL
jgi:hypothetical protein